mgnify:CR=1 FL=1
MKTVILLVAMFFSVAASADYVKATNAYISKVSTYGSGSVAGDVTFKISSPVAGCDDGYYLDDDLSGKEEVLSIVLSAFHTNAKVDVHGYNTPRWSGSSAGAFCKVEGLHLVK